MFLIHPVLQAAGIFMAFYVMKLGISRFRTHSLKQKARFNWKGHVRFGIMATTVLLIGSAIGLYVTKTGWGDMLVTGSHAETGLLMIPFIIFAIGSGIYMDVKKKRRKVLPLIHAICNTVMLLLSLIMIYTGVGVYRIYVVGH